MQAEVNISARSSRYYTMARHWKSDLEFFEIETGFLSQLIEDHFVRLAKGKHLAELISTGKKLIRLQKDESVLSKKLDAQLTQLALMAEDIIPEDSEQLGIAQAELESAVAALVAEYQDVKKKIFSLVGTVMYTDKNL